MSNWYIGQQIVCVKSHSRGLVKEGEIHTIKSLQESSCACKGVDIHIGLFSYNAFERCGKCGCSGIPKTDNYQWFSEFLFAPLGDISELEELLKEKEETV